MGSSLWGPVSTGGTRLEGRRPRPDLVHRQGHEFRRESGDLPSFRAQEVHPRGPQAEGWRKGVAPVSAARRGSAAASSGVVTMMACTVARVRAMCMRVS